MRSAGTFQKMSQAKMGQISPLCAKGVSQQNFTPTEDITARALCSFTISIVMLSMLSAPPNVLVTWQCQ